METQPEIFKFLDYGVVLAILIVLAGGIWKVVGMIHREFIQPLGGKDGIFATFLTTQAETQRELSTNVKRQADAADAHNAIADKMGADVKAIRTDQEIHCRATDALQRHASEVDRDMFFCHNKLAFMMACDDQEKIKDAAREVDHVVSKYLNT